MPSLTRRPGRGHLDLLPSGLRWRLTGWVAVVLIAAAAVTFVVIYRGTGRELKAQIDRELGSAASAFAAQMQASADDSPARLAAVGDLYVHSQPFEATSRLLYAVVPGRPPVTNEPELLGQKAPDGETAQQQQTENLDSRALLRAPPGYSTLPAPDVGDLRLLTRTVSGRGGVVVARIGVGESLSSVRVAQGGVARTFAAAGVVMLVIALLASYLVGARVSQPLRRMARIAARVDEGDLSPRIHADGARTDEVRRLAESFDRMLDRLADAFARQRAFVSDASHELRTPLTVIRGQLELLAREDRPSPDEVRRVERLVQAEVGRMSRLVDELLLLAHSDEAKFLRPEVVDLPAYLSELWMGIEHTADRHFELRIRTGAGLRADPDRLAQALRNLVLNAVEHTSDGSGRVRLTVDDLRPGWIAFIVEDDGPGIPVDQRDRVFDRFHRTDVARSRSTGGTGLGLAIVQAIVHAHGGRVHASESRDLGGARIDIELPALEPPGAATPGTRAAAGRAPARVPDAAAASIHDVPAG